MLILEREKKKKKGSVFYYEPPGFCWKSKASLIPSDQNLFIILKIKKKYLNESLSSPAALI